MAGSEDHVERGAAERNEPSERARQAYVAIGTTTYCEQVSATYLRSLVRTVRQLDAWGIRNSLLTADGPSVGLNRNYIAAHFMDRPELTHLCWIDADQGWSPGHVLRLIEADKDMIGFAIAKKCQDPEFNVQFKSEVIVENGLIEVETLGTGFVMLKRRVFSEMEKRYPEKKIRGLLAHKNPSPHFFGFYENRLDTTGELLGIDVAFSRLWRAMGGTIWIDPSLAVDHIGLHNYRRGIAEYLVPNDK